LLPIAETQPTAKAESVVGYRPLVANVVPDVSPPPAPPETDGMSGEERNHLLQFARRCAYLEQQRIGFSDDEWAQYEYYLYQNILRGMRGEPPMPQLQCWIDRNDAFNQKRRGPTRLPRDIVNRGETAEPKSSDSAGTIAQASTPNAGGPSEPEDKPPPTKSPSKRSGRGDQTAFGKAGVEIVSKFTGVPPNPQGPDQQTIPGSGRKGIRIPDLKVRGRDGSVRVRGTVVEVKASTSTKFRTLSSNLKTAN